MAHEEQTGKVFGVTADYRKWGRVMCRIWWVLSFERGGRFVDKTMRQLDENWKNIVSIECLNFERSLHQGLPNCNFFAFPNLQYRIYPVYHLEFIRISHFCLVGRPVVIKESKWNQALWLTHCLIDSFRKIVNSHTISRDIEPASKAKPLCPDSGS